MLLAYTVVWMVSVVAAIAMGSRLTWWLIWRLLIFVPLFGEIALFSLLGSSGSATLAPGVQPANTLIWGAVVLVYGVILYGPSAIVLGGLGWIAARAMRTRLKVSQIAFILIGTLAGAIVGGCFQIMCRSAAGLGLQNFVAVWTWVSASVTGGAAGGFIVAYYAAKTPSDGRGHARANGVPSIPATY